MSMVIVGAGLSGCIAGLLNPGVKLIEAGARRTEHQAVLRFRESQIGRALGLDESTRMTLRLGSLLRDVGNARVPAAGFYTKLGWTIASEQFEVPTAGPHYRMWKRLAEFP